MVHVSELQEHMQKFLKPSLAKYIAYQILRRYDTDSDGVLSFEEFYKLSLQKESRSRRLLFQYCKYVVPPREQKEDSSGKIVKLFNLKRGRNKYQKTINDWRKTDRNH